MRTSKTTMKAYPAKNSILFLLISFFFFSNYLNSYSQDRETSFKARLINIESTLEKPFRFDLTLHNIEKESQTFSLSSDLPEGWRAYFKSGASQVRALEVNPDATENITFEVYPGPNTNAEEYNLPVYAVSRTDSLKLDLQAVVQGDYDLELTTPSGRLSESTTEGGSKNITLRLKNTGSLPLKDIELSNQSPSHWSVSYDKSKFDQLETGESIDLEATLKVPNKTIAGDYLVTFKAKNSFTNADSQFRITVKTSLLSGWVGIVIILIALGLIFLLIKKYGRR